jgi:hypothetical protein
MRLQRSYTDSSVKSDVLWLVTDGITYIKISGLSVSCSELLMFGAQHMLCVVCESTCALNPNENLLANGKKNLYEISLLNRPLLKKNSEHTAPFISTNYMPGNLGEYCCVLCKKTLLY